ncbi:NreA [Pseudomonas savastanoi pv. phaseolicola]|nr:NreA [Pseudomonas savastanoi pv. phaseolicola]
MRSIITMIEEGRECVDIAQQLHAVEKAVCQAKRTLIQDHIDHCLENTLGSSARGERAPLEAFKQITKYL